MSGFDFYLIFEGSFVILAAHIYTYRQAISKTFVFQMYELNLCKIFSPFRVYRNVYFWVFIVHWDKIQKRLIYMIKIDKLRNMKRDGFYFQNYQFTIKITLPILINFHACDVFTFIIIVHLGCDRWELKKQSVVTNI